MKILTLTGAPRSGKDEFCEYAHCKRGLVYPKSTIDRIKQIAVFGGWSGEKTPEGRKLLSDLKDAFDAYCDLPHAYTKAEIKEWLRHISDEYLADVIFIVQTREPEDIKRWVDENGARAVYIYRESTTQDWGNHADDNVANYDYDYYLTNNGTLEEWNLKTLEFIDKIRNEDWESHL